MFNFANIKFPKPFKLPVPSFTMPKFDFSFLSKLPKPAPKPTEPIENIPKKEDPSPSVPVVDDTLTDSSKDVWDADRETPSPPSPSPPAPSPDPVPVPEPSAPKIEPADGDISTTLTSGEREGQANTVFNSHPPAENVQPEIQASPQQPVRAFVPSNIGQDTVLPGLSMDAVAEAPGDLASTDQNKDGFRAVTQVVPQGPQSSSSPTIGTLGMTSFAIIMAVAALMLILSIALTILYCKKRRARAKTTELFRKDTGKTVSTAASANFFTAWGRPSVFSALPAGSSKYRISSILDLGQKHESFEWSDLESIKFDISK
ncbi:MAG: hypothetical protein SGCHY_001974 [Lobulomycetales sp.]